MCYTIGVKGREHRFSSRGGSKTGDARHKPFPKALSDSFSHNILSFKSEQVALSHAFLLTGAAPVKCAGSFHSDILSNEKPVLVVLDRYDKAAGRLTARTDGHSSMVGSSNG